jgi:hypothetical protein
MPSRFQTHLVAFAAATTLFAGLACTDPNTLPIDDDIEDDALEERFDVGTPLDLVEDADTADEGDPRPGCESPYGGEPSGLPSFRAEWAHTAGGALGPDPSMLHARVTPFVGEACQSSSDCEMGTQCVADELGSDGEFRCLTVCVDPTADNAGSIECLDDDGCCDDAAVCDDQGTCITPGGGGGGGGGGGSDPAADGQGCNEGCDFDRDDDGVVNSLDAHPDQSCSADADQDGINDSCDANDMNADDGCFGCGISRVRTNGLFWAYAIILFVIRQRRPRRGRQR